MQVVVVVVCVGVGFEWSKLYVHQGEVKMD